MALNDAALTEVNLIPTKENVHQISSYQIVGIQVMKFHKSTLHDVMLIYEVSLIFLKM